MTVMKTIEQYLALLLLKPIKIPNRLKRNKNKLQEKMEMKAGTILFNNEDNSERSHQLNHPYFHGKITIVSAALTIVFCIFLLCFVDVDIEFYVNKKLPKQVL